MAQQPSAHHHPASFIRTTNRLVQDIGLPESGWGLIQAHLIWAVGGVGPVVPARSAL